MVMRVRVAPATGKLLLEHRQLLDLRNVEHAPPALERSRTNLVDEQANDAALDAIVVRFGYPPHALVRQFDEPLLGDGAAELMIDEKNDGLGPRHAAQYTVCITFPKRHEERACTLFRVPIAREP
jgi:hypothetical protein